MAEIPFSDLSAGNSPSGEVPYSALGGSQPSPVPTTEIPYSQIGVGPSAQAPSQPVPFTTPSWVPAPPNLPQALQQDIPEAIAQQANPYSDQALGVVSQGMKNVVGDTTSLLAPLTFPLRAGAGLATRLADVSGVAPGASQALIGDSAKGNSFSDYFHQVVPNITFLDLADFTAQKQLGDRDQYAAPLIAKGVAPADAYKQYDNMRLAARGAGILGDFVLDPIALTSFFQPTEAARIAREQGLFKSAEDVMQEAALKGVKIDPDTLAGKKAIIEGGLGDYQDNSRNLIDVKVPLTGKTASVPLPDVATKIASKVNQFTDGLDYTFRIPELDYAASQNTYDKAKAFYDIKNQFLKDMSDLNLNPDEQKLVSRLVENTPNLMAQEIPASRLQVKSQEVVSNVGGDLTKEKQISTQMIPHGSELGEYDSGKIRSEMDSKLGDLAKGLQVNLERREDLLDAGMRIKDINSQINGRQYAAGLIPDDSLSNMIMKNYLAHVPTDEGKAAAKLGKLSDIEMQSVLENQEKTISKGFEQVINSSRLSGFNATRMERSVMLPIEDAQKKMSELYGVKNFYVENPFISTAMRWAQSEKLIADKKFLDQLVHYGIEPATKSERLSLEAKSWGPLDIPDFKGKTITMKLNGIPKSVTMESRLFPPNVVSKVGYWIKPREVGSFAQWLSSYNNVFKTMALMTPGFHVRNMAEDLFKYYANGGSVKNMATGAVTQMLPILPKAVARQSIEINGVKRTYGELRDMAAGLKGASLSRDPGLAEHMFAGKQVFQTIGKNLKDPIQMAKNVVHTLHSIGEGGIHALRGAQYIDLLDKGYSQSAALFRTEQLMFDFRRATPAIDAARTYLDPFIQHAIKTAFLTPELAAKSPAMYNRFITNLPKYLSWTMSDPVTSQYLQQLAPDYMKHRDPVGSLLLPGDSFLASMLQPPKKGMAVFITPELGPGILRKFNIWDSQVVKQRLGLGPAMNTLITMVTGIDQQGKQIDSDPNHPEFASRALRGMLDAASTAAFATPGVLNWVRSTAGIQVPSALPSTNMKLVQAMFGQFFHFDDFNKDYLFKSIALYSAYNELQKQLPGAIAKEVQGRDLSLYMADKPAIVRKAYEMAYPTSAQSMFDRYLDASQDALMGRAALEGLNGKSASQVFSEMKGIKQQIDRINQVHENSMRAVLEAKKNSK